jgi:adenine-specific DNA-methyltransferase
MPEKLKMHTPDHTAQNIQKLAELFPGCVTETRDTEGKVTQGIDFDQLRQELSGSIVEGPRERYHLDWPGKREAVLAANAPIAKTLRPSRNESVNFDTTKNLFIEGDNLDALKLLQETYLGKVKLIYIDPPYNTGRDFIYEDDYSETTDAYLLRSNQTDETGNRLYVNSALEGRFHSDWLSMLLPRLRLARNLLSNDGSIFISIDDGELANLRLICDEVFGASNFIASITWQRAKQGDGKLIARVHDYIVCYARDKSSLIEAGAWRRKKDGVDDVLAQYQLYRRENKDDHPKIRSAMQEWYKSLSDGDSRKAHKHYAWSDDRGLYFSADFAGPDDGRDSRPRYDILHPATGKPCKKPSTGWRWDEDKTKWALSQTPPRIHFGKDETTIPTRRSYLEEVSSEPYPSVLYRDPRSATLEVEALVGKGWFPFPKNTDVLSEIIELATKEDDIVLDFFAGSGSTGHAVMSLNSAQDSHRRFILVQLAEPTDREEFKTIAEITKKRLTGAGEKIKGDTPLISAGLDVGFRVLKIDTSNMLDVYYAPDAVAQADLLGQVDNIRADRSAEDLLFQVFVDWGLDLTLPIAEETIEGREVFFVDKNALAACFDVGVTDEMVKAIAQRKPLRAVFRDSSYGTDSVKINVEQIFKLLSPETEVRSI